MAGAGYKLFNTGDVLLASEVNTYLMQQTVMVFANATARTSALSGVLAEGMLSYLADTNATEVYDGSAWVSVSGTGDITAVTTGANSGLAGGVTTGNADIKINFASKGQLAVGTGSGTTDFLNVGTNGHTLVADSATATGLKWAAPAGGGKVLQVVYGTYSTLTTVASTTYTDTGLSVSITPTSATSTILIFVNQSAKAYRSDESQIGAGVKLLRGSTDIYTPDNGTGRHLLQLGVGNSGSTQSTLGAIYSMIYRDSPATTSSTTYKTQGRVWDSGAGGTAYFQDGSTTSSMLLMEIGA